MLRIYYNFERLVEATLKREQLRYLAYCESLSSTASEFSFDSVREDVADESRSRNISDLNEELRIPKESTAHVAAQIFAFRELAAATQNFRPECFLGEDGFGQVYKGRLGSTGQVVAIKLLDRNSLERNRELVVELLRLCSLRHPNIVNLIGYCADGDRCLLVKEYMPILGSLKDHLHDLSLDQQPLDWNMRMKIAAGVAKGLEYLHTKVNPPVVHRIIKPLNILLDEGYFPKLSNFAIAKLVPDGNLSRHILTWVNRSLGYCAPEYGMTGQLTSKFDVYSFGVVLLELISGRKAIDYTRDAGKEHLVEWVCGAFFLGYICLCSTLCFFYIGL